MNSTQSTLFSSRWFKLLLGIIVASTSFWIFGERYFERFLPAKPFGKIVTLAGTGTRIGAQKTLSDPFGVAADESGNIYVTDGLGGSLYHVTLDRTTTLITDQLDMPSHLAIAPDGNLIVANTGAHTIVKVDRTTKQVSVIAGTPNVSGNTDGKISEAKFNAPLGVAVNKDGVVYVADTYNDRIRIIQDGVVKTLAGSTQGYASGSGANAQFNTPCSIALWANGVVVADTLNNKIRNVTGEGDVTDFTFREELSDSTGHSINEPLAVLTYSSSEMYVLDSGGKIFFAKFGEQAAKRPPLPDGWFDDKNPRYNSEVLTDVQKMLEEKSVAFRNFNHPTSLAFAGKNTLIIGENGGGFVQAITSLNKNIASIPTQNLPAISAEEIRKTVPPRWPYDPPEAKREIAGTLGEIRGEIAPEKDAWFHNGLDIPGAYGEQVRAIYSERITRPIATEGVGDLRERLRLPLLGYIHVKIARDQNDQPLGIKEAIFSRDAEGKISGVRIPRGTRINAGDIIGTLNRFNHVHLIAGAAASEVNALAALELPGLTDTKPPTIEAVRLLAEDGIEISAPYILTNKIKVIVRSYDQADGNVGYRKLGVYKVGYQLLKKDGTALPDFAEPRFNIVFNSLPDFSAVGMVYAAPSQSGYTGKTIFDYIATNEVKNGDAKEGWMDVTKLPAGEYILRVVVEDFFKNRATKDLNWTKGN